MCNILVLKPGVVPEWEKFEIMCFNNWHAYGLVTIVPVGNGKNKLDIRKKVPESGEIDAKEIFDLLVADKDYMRILHVRHATAGNLTTDNCHPFDVYYDQKSGRQVVFMHNGTMYEYKSKKTVGNQILDDDTGPSDTQNFVNRILIPYTSAADFGKGRGDISNFYYQKMIREFWPQSNRGILISNDAEPFTFGGWVTEKDSDGSEYLSSNSDYFKTVKRGPEYERREEARKAAAEKSKKDKTGSKVRDLAKLSDVIGSKKHGFFKLSESPCKLLNDWEFYDRENATCVAFLTRDEIREMMKHEDDAVAVIEWVFTDYANLYDEFVEVEEKHHKASKKIAELMGTKKEKAA